MTRPADETPSTRIATSLPDDIVVRGKSLCSELIGKVTFTEMSYLVTTGRAPTPAQTAVLDACLVALVEHGLTPSTLAARLVYSSAPEAMQAGVAAGLLAVGSVFVGTVEGCAVLLERLVAAADLDAEAARIADEHFLARRPVPGFGHPTHKPDDPRTPVLFAVARAHGVAGQHVAAVDALSRAVDARAGKHLTINATGAVAACLADAAIPTSIMRGLAVLARCAGLVAHIHEEQTSPTMRAIWAAAEGAISYEGDVPKR